MTDGRKVLNLLGVGLDSELAQKAVTAGFTLTRLREASKDELARHFGDKESDLIHDAVKRKAIPRDTLERLIEECGWKCCVCWDYGKESPIILHHIEAHSRTHDDTYDNLAVLCLNHHAEAHSKWGISRHPLPPELIRVKKRDWTEALVAFKAGCRPAPGDETSGVTSRTPLADATVNFSYRTINADYDLDERQYRLIVIVKNQGERTIENFKLELQFPDLGLVPKKWIALTPISPGTEQDRRLVEVRPSDSAVSISRQGYMIQITYHSGRVLFPAEELDLAEAIRLEYRINRNIYSNLADIPPIHWTLYADDMARRQGEVSIAELNNY